MNNDSGFITSDTTKIPLAGTNALSGSIVPDTDNAYALGSSTKQFNRVYTANVVNHNTTSELAFGNVTDGANISLCPKEYNAGFFRIQAFDGTTRQSFNGYANGTLTWGSKNVAMQENVIPRSGGAVMTGNTLARNIDNAYLYLCGGADIDNSSAIIIYGKNFSAYNLYGTVRIIVNNPNLSQTKEMQLKPDGTWKWNGTACQITSDQRLKQQITEIDDKLLDAWEDVEPSQFKYNDAVDAKKDKARLHTGYVVQQIDSACKKHGVDISQYGLYCHEEYSQETEEVEVTHDDGTTTKETKVIREASEHYSLRYTETLIVECAYLRKCIKELRAEIDQLKSSK